MSPTPCRALRRSSPSARIIADYEQVDVVVEVGGWEHACCGRAIERDQLVDLGCVRVLAPDGRLDLSETHHEREPEVRVQGRVRDIHVTRVGQPAEPVLRLPSGEALRGCDEEDDGHLEDPWTGELLPDGNAFLVMIHTSE